MKSNKSRIEKPRLIMIIRDYLTVAFATGAWSAYGPRGWPMDETVMRLLFRWRTEARAPVLAPPAAPAMRAECCMPTPCCAG
jgi:hypothetical protein